MYTEIDFSRDIDVIIPPGDKLQDIGKLYFNSFYFFFLDYILYTYEGEIILFFVRSIILTRSL
jgi:hypothetical protein